ncbi:hypothetical protein BDQ17DRAFT_1437121 [Cyathus striatus]|nr:hypothetical protein BDQ17DRAFT_1437121 [Cyathus striatus]
MVTTRKSSNTTAAASAKEANQETGGAAGVSKAKGKGAKAAKEKKKKGSKKTSIQRLEEDQRLKGSIKQAQTSFSETKDILNEEETLMPLGSQTDVESVKQANVSVTSANTRFIEKTTTSVSGSEKTYNEENLL